MKHVSAADLGGADQGAMLNQQAAHEGLVVKFRDAFVNDLQLDGDTAQAAAEVAASVAETL